MDSDLSKAEINELKQQKKYFVKRLSEGETENSTTEEEEDYSINQFKLDYVHK